MSEKRNSVVVFYVTGGSNENCFTESLVGALSYDGAHQNLIADVRSAEGLYVADGRDRCARRFMRYRLCDVCRDVVCKGDPEDQVKVSHCVRCDRDVPNPATPDWMWFIDTDISFQSFDVLDRLLAVADPVEKPVMSALYFGYMQNNNLVPVWYGRAPDGRIVNLTKFGSGVQQLGVVGMGCCIIHRSVFEKFADKYAHTGWLYFGHDVAPWMPKSDIWNDVTPFGEDNCFCHRCNEQGISIWGFGGVVVEHRKKRYESLETFKATFAQSKVETNATGSTTMLQRIGKPEEVCDTGTCPRKTPNSENSTTVIITNGISSTSSSLISSATRAGVSPSGLKLIHTGENGMPRTESESD